MRVVVIAILAAIVVPRFKRARAEAVSAMLQADLRYLATLQEVYWGEHRVYAEAPAALEFEPSEGVVITVLTADQDGWSATATHSGTPEHCALYVGSAAPAPPAATPGVLHCAEVP